MTKTSEVLPDLPSVIYSLVWWCMEQGHWHIAVEFSSPQTFSLSAFGPGISVERLRSNLWCRELQATAALSQAVVVTSRSQSELTTWRVTNGGPPVCCAQVCRSPGFRIDVSGLFHAAPVRQTCWTAFGDVVQICKHCVQHLALVNPNMRVDFLIDEGGGDQRGQASSGADSGLHHITATTASPPWLAHVKCFQAVSEDRCSRLSAHIVPFDEAASPFQLLAVNGRPVQNSAVQELICRVHTSMHAGLQRRPTRFAESSQPNYLLQLTVPSAAVVWSGPPLQQHAEYVELAMVEGLIACALRHAWRQSMPAMVLSAIEQKSNAAIKPAPRPAPGSIKCVSPERVQLEAGSTQNRRPRRVVGLLQHAAALLARRQSDTNSELAAPSLHSPLKTFPQALSPAPLQFPARTSGSRSHGGPGGTTARTRSVRTIDAFLQDPQEFVEQHRKRHAASAPACHRSHGLVACSLEGPSEQLLAAATPSAARSLCFTPSQRSPLLRGSVAACLQTTASTPLGSFSLDPNLSSQPSSDDHSLPSLRFSLRLSDTVSLANDSMDTNGLLALAGDSALLSSVDIDELMQRSGSAMWPSPDTESACQGWDGSPTTSAARPVSLSDANDSPLKSTSNRQCVSAQSHVAAAAAARNAQHADSLVWDSLASAEGGCNFRDAALDPVSPAIRQHTESRIWRSSDFELAHAVSPHDRLELPQATGATRTQTSANATPVVAIASVDPQSEVAKNIGMRSARPKPSNGSCALKADFGTNSGRCQETSALALFASHSAGQVQKQLQHQPILNSADLLDSSCNADNVHRRMLQDASVISQVAAVRYTCFFAAASIPSSPQLDSKMQMSTRVLLVCSGASLLAIDQHAADERVQLELLQAGLSCAHRPQDSHGTKSEPTAAWRVSQAPLRTCRLPEPQGVPVTWRQHVIAAQQQGELSSWGWQLNLTSKNCQLEVTSVPTIFGHRLPPRALTGFLDSLDGASSTTHQRCIPESVQTLLQSVACRSAIMFGHRLDLSDAAALLQALAGTRLPFHCAHGRPTTAQLVDLGALHEAVARQKRAHSLDSAQSQRRCLDYSNAATRLRTALGRPL